MKHPRRSVSRERQELQHSVYGRGYKLTASELCVTLAHILCVLGCIVLNSWASLGTYADFTFFDFLKICRHGNNDLALQHRKTLAGGGWAAPSSRAY